MKYNLEIFDDERESNEIIAYLNSYDVKTILNFIYKLDEEGNYIPNQMQEIQECLELCLTKNK